MHIGGLRTALFCYLFARKNGGKFILRIEDTDQARYVKGAVEKIYESLEMAGIVCDEGPHAGGDFGPYVQSQRKEIYLRYAEKLVAEGKAYYCNCPKPAEGEELNCNCRNCEIEPDGGDVVIRFAVPKSGTTTFSDVIFGEISVENAEIEDLVMVKSDGMPTYNFANIIDDHLMEISHIMRGTEFLASTPKHKLMYEAFGWTPPTYCHLPPIMSPDGGKLSKRKGDAYFGDFVEKGFLPQGLMNFIAFLGFAPPNNPENKEIFTLAELAEVFDLKGINKSPAVLDMQKLRWMNGEYIKHMPFDQFYLMALPFLDAAIKGDADKKTLAHMVQGRVATLSEIPEILDFVDNLPAYSLDIFINKKTKSLNKKKKKKKQ